MSKLSIPNYGAVPISETIGERIERARKAKHLSQHDLAEVLEVGRQTISIWENDRGYPPRVSRIAVAFVLGVPLEWLETGALSGPSHEGLGRIPDKRSNPPPPFAAVAA